MRPRRYAPELRKYAVNPRAIKCPSCGWVTYNVHVGSYAIMFCSPPRGAVAVEHRRCGLIFYVLREDDGCCYAIPLTPEHYEQLCQYEAAHRGLPAPAAILRHLGLEEAA